MSQQDAADLSHFLKLAAAQVRHRMKTLESASAEQVPGEVRESKLRLLCLLEDLINEQGQTNENTRSAAGATR